MDGSYFLKKGGSFQAIAETLDRFYSTLGQLSLTGKEKIPKIGSLFPKQNVEKAPGQAALERPK